MKTVEISELKNNLCRLLAYVRAGGAVCVVDRGTPIADITPCVSSGTDADEGVLAQLEREGVIRRGSHELDDAFLRRKLPKAGVSVVEALLEERREGR